LDELETTQTRAAEHVNMSSALVAQSRWRSDRLAGGADGEIEVRARPGEVNKHRSSWRAVDRVFAGMQLDSDDVIQFRSPSTSA